MSPETELGHGKIRLTALGRLIASFDSLPPRVVAHAQGRIEEFEQEEKLRKVKEEGSPQETEDQP